MSFGSLTKCLTSYWLGAQLLQSIPRQGSEECKISEDLYFLALGIPEWPDPRIPETLQPPLKDPLEASKTTEIPIN